MCTKTYAFSSTVHSWGREVTARRAEWLHQGVITWVTQIKCGLKHFPQLCKFLLSCASDWSWSQMSPVTSPYLHSYSLLGNVICRVFLGCTHHPKTNFLTTSLAQMPCHRPLTSLLAFYCSYLRSHGKSQQGTNYVLFNFASLELYMPRLAYKNLWN